MLPDNNKDEKELWRRHKENNDTEAKEKLIILYAPLVNSVARRMNAYLAYVELEDLVGYGIFGLIDAIEKFDFKSAVPFSVYARIRIRGAIIDALREIDWAPRSLRQKARRFEEARERLEKILEREPSDIELAAELKIDVQEVREIKRDFTQSIIVSLDEQIDEISEEGRATDKGLIDYQTPEELYEKQETLEILATAINALPERERLVITLYYYEELTLKEVGRVMKIGESRVCQLHKRAVENLKNILGGELAYKLFF